MTELVIVRPEPAASATARAARELGLNAIVLPLFEVEPVEWSVPDPAEFDALLLTSANALRHGGAGLDMLQHLPAFCVGEASAAMARDRGFSIASTGTGGVDSLLATLDSSLRLLHLCGVDRRTPADPSPSVTPVPVYRSVVRDPGGAIGALEGKVVALHSPRSAQVFASLVDGAGIDRSSISLVAISRAAAESAGSGWRAVEIAPLPGDSELLAMAARLCNNGG